MNHMPPRRRSRSSIRSAPRYVVTAVIVAALVTLNACTGEEKTAPDPPPNSSEQLPALASPLPLVEGNWPRNVERLALGLRHGGDATESAMVSTFQAFGLPVVDHDGTLVKVSGASPRGIPVPAWVVQTLVTSHQHGAPSVALSDLMNFFSAAPELGSRDLTSVVVSDLAEALQDPSSSDDAMLWAALGSTADATVDVRGSTPGSKNDLSAIQTQLLLRRLAQEITDVANRRGTAAPPPIAPQHGSIDGRESDIENAAFKVSGSDVRLPPCSLDPMEERIAGEANSRMKSMFHKTLKLLQERDVIGPSSNAMNGYKAANALISVANYYLLVSALTAKVELNNSPLVRTHTKQPGQTRTLTAKVSFEPGSAAMLDCWQSAFAAVGLSGLKAPKRGMAKNLKVTFDGNIGFRESDALPLVSLAEPTRMLTDKEGIAKTSVVGRPQPRAVNQDAPAVDRVAWVKVKVIPSEVSFVKDLKSILDNTNLATGGANLAIILEGIKRAYPVSFLQEIAVRDWQAGRQFRIHASWNASRLPVPNTLTADLHGSATYTGQLGCLPDDAVPDRWACAGVMMGQGSGRYVQYRAENDNTIVCDGDWRVQGLRYEFTAYSFPGARNQIGSFEVKRTGRVKPLCDRLEGLFPRSPIDEGALGAVALPDVGQAAETESTWSTGGFRLRLTDLD